MVDKSVFTAVFVGVAASLIANIVYNSFFGPRSLDQPTFNFNIS